MSNFEKAFTKLERFKQIEKMPSAGLSRSVIQHHTHTLNENRCDCCPYGYHIDRDFVPFTKRMLSREREGDYTRLQELKDKWRCERQSMDELLGVPVIHRDWEVETLSRATTDIWRSVKTPDYSVSELCIGEHQLDSNFNYSLPFGNGLDEAVTDFEEALQRTRPQARVLSFVPDSQKFHTFPRIKAPVLRDLDTGCSTLLGSNNQLSRASSTASSTTTSTVIMKESSSKRHSLRDLSKHDKKMEGGSIKSQSLESTYIQNRDKNESQHYTMSIRLQDLEEKVKLIPELEVKLTQLKEEKRQLLKLLDVQKQNQLNSKVDKNYSNTNESNGSSILISKGNNRDNIRSNKFEDSSGSGPKAPPRRKTRDAGVGKTVLTRDVGVSHTMPRTRSIGVGGTTEISSNWDRVDPSSPTGSLSGTLRRRIKSFETGVQVNNHDLMDESATIPILQIIERKDIGVQALLISDPLPSQLQTKPTKIIPSQGKTVGITAKPSTRDVGYTAKPTLKDSSSNTVQEPEQKMSRSVGITASLGNDTLTEEKTKLKPLKTVGSNTDRQRVHTIGVNTTEVFDKVSSTVSSISSVYQRKSVSPSRSDRVSVERAFTYESKDAEGDSKSTTSSILDTSTEKEAERKPIRSCLSLPVQTSQGPRQIGQSYSGTFTQSSDSKGLSRIPRLASPLVSPVASPKTVSKPISISSTVSQSQNYSSLDDTGSSSSSSVSPTNAPVLPYKSSSTSAISPGLKRPAFFRSDTYTKEMHLQTERHTSNVLEPLEEEERERPKASTSFGFLQENREKATPSKEMQGALKVLNDALLRGRTTKEVTTAISIILHEWFRVAGTKTANPLDVEDYLDAFESYSPQLLRYIVNMPDGNGNTAMHYAVSHGNFDVVSILLDSKVCDPNKANKAGYTSVMLVSLAKVLSDTHRQVVRRLFGLGDVNIKAAQHGQTALMLGASHGRLDTVRLLLEAGADINIQDEDGSTALMCASEHGHGEIVKYLLAQPDCDPHITDNDGSTALTVAMEAGHKDIGVMLYAHMHFVKAPSSPYASGLVRRSRSTTPRSTPSSKSNSPATSAQTSPIATKKQSSMFP